MEWKKDYNMKNYVQKKPFEIKGDDFMLIEGKYKNLLISEVDDLNYLKTLKYKPWVINSDILSEIINYRIVNFKNKEVDYEKDTIHRNPNCKSYPGA